VYVVNRDLFSTGAGALDTTAAMADTSLASGAAISPRVYVDASGRVAMAFDTVSGVNIIWGTNIVWGSNIIWGTALVSGSNIVWGTNIIWGTSNTGGYNIVWGASSPWASSSLGAANSVSGVNLWVGETSAGGCLLTI
jgi:hypothetical protein